ncbi:hypothetical protein J7K43_02915 [Candidatus Calescamantes bacterium]|nr:hypothetical protein [Candidatus Calescamantes bacterium]
MKRKGVSIVFFLTYFLGIAQSNVSFAKELLLNPDMEKVSQKRSLPDGWEKNSSYPKGIISLISDSKQAHSGSNFLKIVSDSLNEDIALVGRGTKGTIPVVSEAQYQFNVWLKGKGKVRLFLYLYNEKGYIGSRSTKSIDISTDKWEKHSLKYSPSGHNSKQVKKILCAIHVRGVIYADDASFQMISAPAVKGTLGLWCFDDGLGSELLKDSSEYKNHGTLVNMDISADWVNGKFTYKNNYALDFDGIDDYVVIPNSHSLNPSSGITLEAWIYPRSEKGCDIISKKSYNGYRLGIGIASIHTDVGVYDVIGSKPSFNTWHHIAATYDGKELKLYLDGKLEMKIPAKGNLVQVNDPLYIGARNLGSGVSDFFDGIIDEVRILDKPLSEEEIVYDYRHSLKEREGKLKVSLFPDYNKGKLEVEVNIEEVEKIPSDFKGYIELRKISEMEPVEKKLIKRINTKNPVKRIFFNITKLPPGEYGVRAYLIDKKGNIFSAKRKNLFIMPGRNLIVVPYVKTGPTIDGKINDDEWKYATSVTGFVDTLGKLAKNQTQVFLCYDDKNLYLAFKSSFPGSLKSITHERDNLSLFRDDSIEIFLQPEPSVYYQFAANSTNTIFDSKRKDFSWDAKWECKSYVKKEGRFFVGGTWTSEIVIPFEELGVKTPTDGDIWGGNFCRDWQVPEGTYWTSWVYTQGDFHRPELFGKLLFKKETPGIKIENVGNLSEREVNINGKISNPSLSMKKVFIQMAVVSTSGTKIEKIQSLTINPQKSVNINIKREIKTLGGEIEPLELNLLVLDILSNQTLYQTRIPFTCYPSFRISLIRIYNKGFLGVKVNIEKMKELPVGFKGYAEIRRQGKTQSLLSKEIKELNSANRVAETSFDISKLSPGEYEVKVYLEDSKRNVISSKTVSFTIPKRPIWLGNKIGISEKVPSPWIPIKVSGSSISCWGRRYEFNNLPFPSKIVTKGESILYSPIELKAIVDGNPVVWKKDKLRYTFKSETEVKLQMESKGPSLNLNGKIKMEYDGLMKIDFSLTPTKSVNIDSLVLEIPINRKNAKYLKARNLVRGKLFTASIGDESLASGNIYIIKPGDPWIYSPTGWRWENIFIHSLWIGDDERGLLWLCESEKNWKRGKKIVEVIEEPKVIKIKFNIIATPLSFDKPLNYTIGLLATPCKPFPKNYLEVVKTSFMMVRWTSNWTDRYGYIEPKNPRQLKNLIKKAHKQGEKVLLGFSFGKTDINTKEFKIFGDEWKILPAKYSVEGKKSITAGICPESSFPDFMLYQIEKLIEEYDIDGFYLDCSGSAPCANHYHSCGYWNGEKWCPKVNFFATHEFYKRVYTLFKNKGKKPPIIFHHCLDPELASFVDVTTTGEQYYRAENYDNLFANDCRQFRAEFMEHQFGPTPQFFPVLNIHYYPGGPKLSMDEILALTLIHNVLPTLVSGSSPDVSRIKKGIETNQTKPLAKVWKVMEDFGIDEAEWFPYWKNQFLIKSSSDKVKISLYRKKGKALLVVSNIGEKDEVVNLKVNLVSLGFTPDGLKIKNPVSNEEFLINNGKIKLLIPRKRMRFLLLKEENNKR